MISKVKFSKRSASVNFYMLIAIKNGISNMEQPITIISNVKTVLFEQNYCTIRYN